MRRNLFSWQNLLLVVIVMISLFSMRSCAYRRIHGSRPIRIKYTHRMNENNGKEDIPLKLWKQTKTVLPPVITGDYTGQRGDSSPLAALYNMLFVRIPTIAAGFVYASKLNDSSWALICDLGFGQFEVPPTLVALAILVILS